MRSRTAMAAELGFIFWSFDRKRNIPISKLKYRREFPWLNAIGESCGRQHRLIVLQPCFQRAAVSTRAVIRRPVINNEGDVFYGRFRAAIWSGSNTRIECWRRRRKSFAVSSSSSALLTASSKVAPETTGP